MAKEINEMFGIKEPAADAEIIALAVNYLKAIGLNDLEVEINSLYDGFVTLYQTKNYSFDVVHIYGSFREEVPTMIFNKNFIGYDNATEDLDVYYNDGTGIYRVSFGDDFLAGEYILDKSGNKYTNLWDNTLVSTMYGQSGAYIKSKVGKHLTEIAIEDKDYKLRFLQTIMGNVNYFATVDSLTAKYENGKVSFFLSINSGADTYKVTLKDAGTTTSTHLKTFVKSGGKPLEVKRDLSEMRRLLELDNYVQRTYMVDGENHYWAGFQFFTPHYFFTTGNDSTVGNGYMEFNYKESPELDNDFDMWGIYLVNISKGEQGQMQAALVSANAYNSSTIEIEECCNYPSRKLDILRNLEYIKEGEIRTANYEETTDLFKEESHKYYFTDEDLVDNFCKNFSLDRNFADVAFNTIALEIGLAENDKDCIVCFHALGYYAVDGINYDIIIPLYNFGDAKRNVLDILYEQYNNNN